MWSLSIHMRPTICYQRSKSQRQSRCISMHRVRTWPTHLWIGSRCTMCPRPLLLLKSLIESEYSWTFLLVSFTLDPTSSISSYATFWGWLTSKHLRVWLWQMTALFWERMRRQHSVKVHWNFWRLSCHKFGKTARRLTRRMLAKSWVALFCTHLIFSLQWKYWDGEFATNSLKIFGLYLGRHWIFLLAYLGYSMVLYVRVLDTSVWTHFWNIDWFSTVFNTCEAR